MQRSRLLVALLIALTANVVSAQVNAVEQFLTENPNVEKFFIYQSSLRMLNQGADPDFNKLIKDIRKINVYISEAASESATQSYRKMVQNLGAEEFETLVNVKNDGMRINLMSRDSGSRSLYVLAASEGSNFAVMEMDGSLDLRYLESLEHLDFAQLRKIVGQDKGNDEQKTTDEE